ncbi:hypothetical protein GJ744_011722 [Endocarpon pusillum]|uniref:Uncharacterized protein n=1 Tax=Endocarpon pusillum TaxID=364733 RepID=A0A8H7E201_9EURO|nr:hypothetical protein GJ744_011722 [Endocarpon pusillum]
MNSPDWPAHRTSRHLKFLSPSLVSWVFVGRKCLRHLACARTWPIFGNQPHRLTHPLSDSQRSDNSAKTLQSDG